MRIPVFSFDSMDLIRLLDYSKRKRVSLYEALDEIDNISGIKNETKKATQKILELLSVHAKLARNKKVSEVLVAFLEESGYMKLLKKRDNLEEELRFQNIVELFKRIQLFEQAGDTESVKDFVEELELATEGGEDPAPAELEEGPDTIKVMTIHKAKGLEFPVVFVVSLIEGHFPSRDRKEPLSLPDDLLEEKLPEESHIQEERRLFYVALTRAQDRLYLTGANDYGGKRKRKISRFVKEIDTLIGNSKISTETLPSSCAEKKEQKKIKEKLPAKFSYTQLEAFKSCPLQYKFAHLLKVPTSGSHTYSYGKSLHGALSDFYQAAQEGNPGKKDLLAMLESNWLGEFYESKSHEEDRHAKAKNALEKFYDLHKDDQRETLYIEQGFNMKIGDYVIRGAIDRVDKHSDGQIEIIDYKTGKSDKGEKDIKRPVQLLLYALALEQIFELKADILTLYYVDGNKPYSIEREKFEPKLEDIKTKTLGTIQEIIKSDFCATPSSFVCQYCDFRMICPERK